MRGVRDRDRFIFKANVRATAMLERRHAEWTIRCQGAAAAAFRRE